MPPLARSAAYPASLVRHLARKQCFRSTSSRGHASAAAATVESHNDASTSSHANPAFSKPPSRPSSSSGLASLPFVSSELSNLKSSLFHLLGSSHPALDAVAKYYFQAEGKHLRPMLVLLMAQATNGLGGSAWSRLQRQDADDVASGRVDESLTSVEGVLNDWNPEQMGLEGEGDMIFATPYQAGRRQGEEAQLDLRRRRQAIARGKQTAYEAELAQVTGGVQASPILSTQRRLASITEMIHVASLLHDDVIDDSPLRRGEPSAPQKFSNKLSILAGDFLLGRASVALARLGSNEVVELLATVIANLVEGEVMQLRQSPLPASAAAANRPSEEAFEAYMRKTYLKTASLMAKSARASVILGGCGGLDRDGASRTRTEVAEGEWVKDVAYGFGRNLGIAFQVSRRFGGGRKVRRSPADSPCLSSPVQLIDDMLDFLPPSPELGKPGLGADLSLGLTTAPSLFAWRSNPALGPLIARKFSEPGDVEAAREMVTRSDGLERTRDLAIQFADEARKGIEGLPDGDAKEALIGLTRKVVDRVS